MQNIISSGQFLTFFTLLAVGLSYLVVTSLLGILFGAVETDSGDSAEHADDTVSIFSPKIIAIFMVGFGAGGAIATHYELSTIGATIVGLITGCFIGGIAIAGLRLLHSQQSNSEISTSDTIGLSGTVTISISPKQVGEVDVVVNRQVMTYHARSERACPKGTLVKILSASGGELFVG